MDRPLALHVIAVLTLTTLFACLSCAAADKPLAPGTIITVAGTGTQGYSGDGGPATAAELNAPAGVAVDTAGNLFIADFRNHRLRKLSPDGTITTVAGKGGVGGPEGGFSGDGGPARDAQLNLPLYLAFDGAGNLFITDYGNNRVRRIGVDGIISTVAGKGPSGEFRGTYSGDGGLATKASLNGPLGPATDAAGNLFIADALNYRVRKVGLDGTITTVAGNGVHSNPRDGSLANKTQLGTPNGLARDGAGNLFISDQFNHQVYKVGPDGLISTVAGGGPRGYGNGGYSGDGGPARDARFDLLHGLAVDSAGNLFVADASNHRIREIGPDGIVITVAGGGNPADGLGDGGPATEARLGSPAGVAVDAEGNLFFADQDTHRVRKVFGVAAPGLIAGLPFPKPNQP
jgi:hypothetical protein